MRLVTFGECSMRHLLFAATLAFAATSPVHAEDWAVDAHWQTPSDLARIAPYFQHLKVDRKNHTVSLIADDAQLALLDDMAVDYRIDMATTANMRIYYAQAFNPTRSIPGFACYRTVEETYATMDQLAAAHPSLAQVIDIGPTWARTQNAAQGYRMRVMRIGNTATDATIPNKPNMVVFSSIHAREYAPAEVNTHFAEWLLDNYGSDPEATWLVDHENFHLILQANPDGRKKAETGLSWRKNTNTVSASCGNSSGIDLNRNFPFHWGIVPGNGGSSGSICNETYRGPLAESEPETANLVAYVAGNCGNDGVCTGGVLPDLRSGPLHPANVNGDGGAAAPDDYPGMFLDVHSYAELVLWPWGDTSTAAPNMTGLRTFGKRMAWFNNYVPEQSDTLYPTDGTTDDTFYGMLGVPAYTFELDVQFFEPCDALLSKTIPDNLAALRYAARNVHAPYLLPGGPDVTRIEASPDLVATGSPVMLSVDLNDSRFKESGGSTEPVHAISSAAAYLDGLPWEGSLPIAALTAADGAFDSPVESATTSLATVGLASGKHVLFVQGTDTSSRAGTPNATFIEIADASEIASLSGTITARNGGVPLATTLRVTNDSTGESRTSSSAVDGSYLRTMHAGTVSIHVDAPSGYLAEDIGGVSLIGGATQTRNIALFSACELFFDDIESGSSGWTVQSPWVRSGSVTGNTSQVWVTQNYPDNANASLSRSLDLSGYAGSTLSFDDRCDTESGYDYGRVEVSVNGGGTWTSLYQCSGRTTWQNNRIALPASTDNVSDMRLRFRLTSDTSVTRSGWAIDNIRVESGGVQCRADQSDRIFVDGFDL
jgi:carboxypeptidase T